MLLAADPSEKCAAAARSLTSLDFLDDGEVEVLLAPARPARPVQPILVPPREVPGRSLTTVAGRIALLHALAHIEFNAIDLAFDMALRFEPEIRSTPLDSSAFVRDWFRIGAEEAAHFQLVNSRLENLGAAHGDLPAHAALWDAAERTSDSVLARLAIAPLVLEARGLDVTPGLAVRLRAAGDEASSLILDRILSDEVGHVACGVRWFEQLCEARGLPVSGEFQRLVGERFPGGLKPPFNRDARNRAGLFEAYYSRWNGICEAQAVER